MKRNIVVIGLLAMLCAVLTFTIPVDQAQAKSKTVQLRLVVPAPPGDWPLTYVCEQLAKGFNERVKKGYNMEVFAGGVVAVLPEYFNALRVGAVEMALAPWTFYAFMDQRLGLIETPFILNNNEEEVTKQTDWMHSVMKEMDDKDYAELRKKNVEIYKLPAKERERWVKALIPFREKTTFKRIRTKNR